VGWKIGGAGGYRFPPYFPAGGCYFPRVRGCVCKGLGRFDPPWGRVGATMAIVGAPVYPPVQLYTCANWVQRGPVCTKAYHGDI